MFRFVIGLIACLGSFNVGAQEKLTFLTSWYGQAEHGGFYQALATGLYRSRVWTSASAWADRR
jgi:ABC-type nitrate/sulfonate/bicarbonate transport system substrate-binding protein